MFARNAFRPRRMPEVIRFAMHGNVADAWRILSCDGVKEGWFPFAELRFRCPRVQHGRHCWRGRGRGEWQRLRRFGEWDGVRAVGVEQRSDAEALSSAGPAPEDAPLAPPTAQGERERCEACPSVSSDRRLTIDCHLLSAGREEERDLQAAAVPLRVRIPARGLRQQQRGLRRRRVRPLVSRWWVARPKWSDICVVCGLTWLWCWLLVRVCV